MVRVRAIWGWLAEACHVWLTTTVIAIALLLCLCVFTTERGIRLTGLCLQILGVGTVAWGIAETRALFGYPPVIQKAWAWIKRCPLKRRTRTVNLSGRAAAQSSAHANLSVRFNEANLTSRERIVRLERHVDELRKIASQIQEEMCRELSQMSYAINLEEQTRQKEDLHIKDKLEAAGAGGIHISAIGAAWIFSGLILSTASAEIASSLN